MHSLPLSAAHINDDDDDDDKPIPLKGTVPRPKQNAIMSRGFSFSKRVLSFLFHQAISVKKILLLHRSDGCGGGEGDDSGVDKEGDGDGDGDEEEEEEEEEDDDEQEDDIDDFLYDRIIRIESMRFVELAR